MVSGGDKPIASAVVSAADAKAIVRAYLRLFHHGICSGALDIPI